MTKLIGTILLFAISFNASALIIRGEDSYEHFLIAEEVGEEIHFLECEGSYEDYLCDSFFQVPVTFTKDEIRMMASDKKVDAYLALVADVGIAAAAIVFPFIAAKLEIAYYAGVLGYSTEGLGAASAIAGAGTSAVGAPASMISFDVLDPFVHRDLSLSLSAIIDEADYGDLDDIEARETQVDREVTVEDVTTAQVKKSFKKLLDAIIEGRRGVPHKIIFAN
tara:strand:- start:278671 stop:279336 length:666 start_codon:yes stop_codon:yes gene_type:complete